MNALNSVQSYTNILKTIIQVEFQNLTKILQKHLKTQNLKRHKISKDIKFPFKITGIHNIEEKNSISISVFGYENKEKYPFYVSKNTFKRYIE